MKWWIAVNLAFCGAINYADRSALSAVLPAIRGEMHLSDVQLASLGSVFLWSYALFSPVAGFIADRTSRARVIVISVAAWSLVAIVSGLTPNFPALLTTRVLLGLAECFYLPCATALLAGFHGAESRGTAMAVHSVGLNLGVVAGGASAGWLADHFGWRAAFLSLGAVGLLIASVSFFVLRDPDGGAPVKRRQQSIAGSVAELVSIRSYLAVLTEMMLVAVGVWTFFNWLPLYFRDTYGLTLASAGFAGTFSLQIAAVAGMSISGYWSDRLARRSKSNRMLLQASSFIIAAPFLLIFLARPSFLLVNAGIFAFALMRGMGQANDNPVLCDVVPPRLRSTAIGIMNTGASLAGGIGIMAAGIAKPFISLGGFFALTSVAFLAAGVLLLVTYRLRLPRDLARNEMVDVQ